MLGVLLVVRFCFAAAAFAFCFCFEPAQVLFIVVGEDTEGAGELRR